MINWFGITDVPDVITGPNRQGAAARWFGDPPATIDAAKLEIAKQVSPLLCAIATVAETLRSGAYTVDASGGEYRYRATAEAGSWCAELRTIGSDPRRPGTVTVEFRAGVPTRVQIEP